MHETVTLQFGNRANYLATHFWNTQESYFTYPTPTDPTPAPSLVDHDINFRPGIGADGSDTYTPRTLIYDFQANLGGLRRLNALYDTLKPQEPVRGLWDGIQQTQAALPIQPIQYQIDLESGLPTHQLYSRDVRYWSDFNRLFYHPRSTVALSPHSFSSSLNATEVWSNGTDLYKDLDREFDLLDRDVRPFVEECDSLSTFQIFSSVDDSWGGYATSYVEALREEYGKKGIWVWAVEEGRRTERSKQYRQLANSAKSLRAIAQSASAYIRVTNAPASLPEYVQLEHGSEWSTAALICAATETVTLPARLREGGRNGVVNTTMFEDVLNTNGNQNIWTLKARSRTRDTSLRDQRNGNARVFNGHGNGNGTSQALDPRLRPSSTNPGPSDSLDQDNDLEPSTFAIDFTPSIPSTQSTFPSLTRPSTGSSPHIFSQLESHRSHPHPQLSLPFTTSTSTSTSTNSHTYPTLQDLPILQVHHTTLPFPLLTSYPSSLFSHAHHHELLIDASLSTTSSTKHHVHALRDIVAGRFGRGMGLIETDEVEAVYDELTRVGDAYGFGWEGSGDDDDDDDGD